jgi:hypothetical protein
MPRLNRPGCVIVRMVFCAPAIDCSPVALLLVEIGGRAPAPAPSRKSGAGAHRSKQLMDSLCRVAHRARGACGYHPPSTRLNTAAKSHHWQPMTTETLAAIEGSLGQYLPVSGQMMELGHLL